MTTLHAAGHRERPTCSHRQFRHPDQPGMVTIPGSLEDAVPRGTWLNILRQAGLRRSS
ncbi:type II toxin-antitoxin system HicA family toxin [Candidatus Poriferisodalis sp.]|uniref:type II toxin-antitoxin system HicA family toxin n=1 Tax=Candidatus Poriferisodalis sp. TaxID=3101277 RepID=UPI003C7007FF